jgi:hypothetical protein
LALKSAAAEEILRKDRNKEIYYSRVSVPKEFFTLWLEFIQGNHPKIEQFGGIRQELNRRVAREPRLQHSNASLGASEHEHETPKMLTIKREICLP